MEECMAKLLFVDDDTEVLGINMKFMKNAGFEVIGSDKAVASIKLARDKKPDCIILDVMMPDMNGYDVAEKIRSFSDVPIIFLTGRGSEEDKLKGLILGGDDYIVKPYSLKELKVRIDVVLRRYSKTVSTLKEDSNIAEFGKVKINRLEHKVYYDGEEIILTNREYEALIFLTENPDRIVTFEEIGKKIFGQFLDTDRQTIMVIMSRLRKKMKVSEQFSNMIETAWGKGYKFISGNK
jgi:DNA-binding response OmpR family regulator